MADSEIGIASTQEISTPELMGDDTSGVVVELLYKGKVIQVEEGQLPYKLGREDTDCDLFIPAIVASRHHCTICIEEGRLGVLDTSTNGTFVQIGQAKEICVKDEFFPILGKGMLKLGEPVGCGDKNLIFFRCP